MLEILGESNREQNWGDAGYYRQESGDFRYQKSLD